MSIFRYKKKLENYIKNNLTEDNRKVLIVAFLIGAFGLLLFAIDTIYAKNSISAYLERKSAGEGKYSEEFVVYAEGESFDYEVVVEEMSLTKEEAKARIEAAIAEINQTFCMKNDGFDHIEEKVLIEDYYADDMVEAQWSFDNYKVISPDGEVIEKNTSTEGTLVNATVSLICQSERQEYTFAFVVYPKTLSFADQLAKNLDELFQKENEEECLEEVLTLPESVDGKAITWKKKTDYRGLVIALLSLVLIVGILAGARIDSNKNDKEITEKKIRDYPLIVSNLSILMGAGMSFKAAVERMCMGYLKKKRLDESVRLEGYEELLITVREMKDGVGEIDAIENLGRRCNIKEYRKLSMLLSQNIKKGTTDLIMMLEKENQVAFEMRKSMALRAGEEASTKLMLPMMGMLGIVLVILMVPAMLSMGM